MRTRKATEGDAADISAATEAATERDADAMANAKCAHALAAAAEAFAQLAAREKEKAEKAANSAFEKNKVSIRMRRAALIYEERAGKGVKLEGNANEGDQ